MPTDISARIQSLLNERQAHTDAFARIEETLDQIARLVGGLALRGIRLRTSKGRWMPVTPHRSFVLKSNPHLNITNPLSFHRKIW